MTEAGIRSHLVMAQHSGPGWRIIATVMIHCTIFLTIFFLFFLHSFFYSKFHFFFLGFNNKFKNFMKLKHFIYEVRLGFSLFSRPISLRFCKALKWCWKNIFSFCCCLAMLCKISFDISHDTSRRKRFSSWCVTRRQGNRSLDSLGEFSVQRPFNLFNHTHKTMEIVFPSHFTSLKVQANTQNDKRLWSDSTPRSLGCLRLLPGLVGELKIVNWMDKFWSIWVDLGEDRPEHGRTK